MSYNRFSSRTDLERHVEECAGAECPLYLVSLATDKVLEFACDLMSDEDDWDEYRSDWSLVWESLSEREFWSFFMETTYSEDELAEARENYDQFLKDFSEE